MLFKAHHGTSPGVGSSLPTLPVAVGSPLKPFRKDGTRAPHPYIAFHNLQLATTVHVEPGGSPSQHLIAHLWIALFGRLLYLPHLVLMLVEGTGTKGHMLDFLAREHDQIKKAAQGNHPRRPYLNRKWKSLRTHETGNFPLIAAPSAPAWHLATLR